MLKLPLQLWSYDRIELL